MTIIALMNRMMDEMTAQATTPRLWIVPPLFEGFLNAELQALAQQGESPPTTWATMLRTVLAVMPEKEIWVMLHERPHPVVFELAIPYAETTDLVVHWH